MKPSSVLYSSYYGLEQDQRYNISEVMINFVPNNRLYFTSNHDKVIQAPHREWIPGIFYGPIAPIAHVQNNRDEFHHHSREECPA